MPDSEAQRIARDLHILAALTRRALEEPVTEHAQQAERISFLQLSVLVWLERSGPRWVRDVATYLSVSLPAATQVVGRLKRRGLVRSRPSRADRRAAELTLSTRGRAFLRRQAVIRRRRIDALLGGATASERAAIARGLETAIALLVRDRERTTALCLHCTALAAPGCVLVAHGLACPIAPRPSA